MKPTERLVILSGLLFIFSAFSLAQETPLFPPPDLSRFAVHEICRDKSHPPKLAYERYKLYKIKRGKDLPLNAFADVITTLPQGIQLMTYYVFDGQARIGDRQFVKTVSGNWKEVGQKEFEKLVRQHLDTLPKKYFAVNPGADHSLFTPGTFQCK